MVSEPGEIRSRKSERDEKLEKMHPLHAPPPGSLEVPTG